MRQLLVVVYSQFLSERFQAKMDDALHQMVELLRTQLKDNLMAVVLGGGYGRGFGTVRVLDHDVTPFNDIDLISVTNESVARPILDELAGECTAFINAGSRYRRFELSPLDVRVDLDGCRLGDLARFPPTMHSFDLKYGGRVLCGHNVLGRLPAYSGADIPAVEAVLLLCNRAFSMCECLSLDSEPEGAAWLYYVSVKAIVDSGAALLIMLRQYATSPSERLRILARLAKDDRRLPRDIADLFPLFQEYTRRKSCITRNDCDAALFHWKKAKDVILRVLDHCLSQVFGLPAGADWRAKTAAFIPGWERERRRGMGWRSMARRRARQALARAGLIRGADLGGQDYVLACAPHLLRAVQVVESAETVVARLHEPSLRLVGEYLQRARVTVSLAGHLQTGDGEWAAWRRVRDVAVDAWKSRA